MSEVYAEQPGMEGSEIHGQSAGMEEEYYHQHGEEEQMYVMYDVYFEYYSGRWQPNTYGTQRNSP